MTLTIKDKQHIHEEPGIETPQHLRDCVAQAMQNYFQQLDGQDAVELYEMVLSEVEAPLMEAVMEYVNGNQTKASQITGLNRGTLRKKLKKYGML
ncbi:MAG: DNA-binding transcriptional regulator Fis [Gammaproteobacteria bacterium]|nr:DNA-binding transcriptional regulator Fis [Gammaproteobacteria bacterium]NNJ71911.1 DNA-binding transcriptional regulator Fis [Enterobacterales bacterium]